MKINSVSIILNSILIFIALFLVNNYISMLLFFMFLFLIFILNKISFGAFLNKNKFLIAMIFISSMINLFFVNSGKIDEIAIKSSAFMFFKLSILCVMGFILASILSQKEFSKGLEKIMSPLKIFKINPQKLAFTTVLSLRFLPILSQSMREIILAQRLRGVDFSTKNPLKKIKFYAKVVLPLMLAISKKSEDLILALECRNYDPSIIKPSPKIIWNKIDFLSFFSIILVLAGVIFCNKI